MNNPNAHLLLGPSLLLASIFLQLFLRKAQRRVEKSTTPPLSYQIKALGDQYVVYADKFVELSINSTEQLIQRIGDDGAALRTFLMDEIGMTNDFRMALVTKLVLGYEIRVIDFEDFKRVGEIPRFSHNQNPQDTCLPPIVQDFSTIDFTDCLNVFVSHCWLRGHDQAAGWSGRPHPDDVSNSKYKLCVEGIEKLKIIAPDARRVFLWLDFSCLDQDGEPALEMKYLDKIIGWSDIIFTPIVDDDHTSWTSPSIGTNLFEGYKAKAWREGDHAYLNRGWCRLEMLYARAIPLAQHAQAPERVSRISLASFKTGRYSSGRRGHVLYGSKEASMGHGPRALPRLQDSYFNDFNPSDGHVTNPEKVKPILEKLMVDLETKGYVKRWQVGYEGQRDWRWRRHGRGKAVFNDGAVYDGEWAFGERQGKGIFHFANGDFYDGEWAAGERHGKGVHNFADGAVYEGSWENDREHGKGVYRKAYGSYDGAVYEGEWKNGKKHGKGVYWTSDRYINKEGVYDGAHHSVYKGEWMDGKEHGKGVWRYVNGANVTVYEGEWMDGKEHGKGVWLWRYVNGGIVDFYDGEWMNGKKHGKGVCHWYANGAKGAHGAVYEGEWKNDKKHGKGVYKYPSGDVYDGEWVSGKRQGKGVFRFADGDIYDGNWINDKKHGKGILRYANGDAYDGNYADGKRHGKGVHRSANGDVCDREYVDGTLK